MILVKSDHMYRKIKYETIQFRQATQTQSSLSDAQKEVGTPVLQVKLWLIAFLKIVRFRLYSGCRVKTPKETSEEFPASETLDNLY